MEDQFEKLAARDDRSIKECVYYLASKLGTSMLEVQEYEVTIKGLAEKPAAKSSFFGLM